MHRRLSIGAAAVAILALSTSAAAQATGTTSRGRAGTAIGTRGASVRAIPVSGVVRRAPLTANRIGTPGRAITDRAPWWVDRRVRGSAAIPVRGAIAPARGTVFRTVSAVDLAREQARAAGAGRASGHVVRAYDDGRPGRASARSWVNPYGRPGLTGTVRHIEPPACIPGAPRCPAPRNPTDRPIILPAPIPVFWGWTPFGWSVAPLYAPSTIFVVDVCQEPQEAGKRKRRSVLSWLYRGGRLSDLERGGWPWTTHLRSPLLSGMVAFDCDPVGSCAALEVTRGASQRWLFDVTLPQLGATTADALADVVSARLDRGEIVRLQHPDGGEFDLRPVRGQRVQAAQCSV